MRRKSANTARLVDQTIDSFEELAALVQPFRKDGAWIFRGVGKPGYKLVPKIGRPDTRKTLGPGLNEPYNRTAEETMTRHFVRAAGPYLRQLPATTLEWLALAQHHGMTTRLLDWTQSLFVAAYFAVEDARGSESSPTIYCIRDVPVAPHELHDRIDDLPEYVLYYPPHVSPRIPAQSGLFTVHRNPAAVFSPERVIRLTIGRSPLTMKLNLNACGIHKASLFPDIGGLAEHESWLYKWGQHLGYGA
jgi:hypothetical protein